MTGYSLQRFIEDAKEAAQQDCAPHQCVASIAPRMMQLLTEAGSLPFAPEHLREDPNQTARNLVYQSEDNTLSLYVLVWRPGQWTPVHDHGSWGVVGVIQGLLEERNYIRMNPLKAGDDHIDLRPGGIILMNPGSVTTFVPNPDHIHETGASADGKGAITLHLYGRNMDSYNVYDLWRRTRTRISVAAENMDIASRAES
ncbi:MAG: cysteine dioxygenase family protein [Myxococcota bacterium]